MRRLAWTVASFLAALLSLSLVTVGHSSLASAAGTPSLSDRRAMPLQSHHGQALHSPVREQLRAQRLHVESRMNLDATAQLGRNVTGRFAAEAGAPGRLRTMRADPERGSIGGQWPTPTASNCRQCADDIQRMIGGQQAVIGPVGSGRVLGPSANNPAGDWFEHVAVVKDGRVYDGFTGRAGMPIDDFKAQFQYGDAINFGF